MSDAEALQQLQQAASGLTWDRFLSNDRFRSLSPGEQGKVRTIWMQGIAPIVYPQIQSDTQARGQLANYVYGSRAIPYREYEKDIFSPSSVSSYRGWEEIENNPTYRGLDFREQQDMKSVWYQKLSVNDPDFAALPDENREAFYERLMSRPPGYGRGESPIQLVGESTSGLFRPLPIENLWEGGEDLNETIPGWQKLVVNFAGSLATSASALIAGPLSLINPEGKVPEFFRDVHKQKQWMNMVSDRANFLTESIPSFAGTIAGMFTGPYPRVESAFAKLGGDSLRLLAPSVPRIVGTTAGAGMAGIVQGVGESLAEGRPWNSNLLADATLGVGLEFAGRFVGAMREASKVANELGVPMRDMLRPAMNADTNLTQALERVYQANPVMEQIIKELRMVDQHGFRLKTLRTPRGVDMVAYVLELETRHLDDAVEIYRGNDLIGRFEGPEQVRISNAINFMFHDPVVSEIWEKTMAGKSLMEAAATAPQVEVRKIEAIPEAARDHIYEYFAHHNMPDFFTTAGGVREQTDRLDEVYRIIRKQSVNKAADSLHSLGIDFDGGGDAHKAATAQLRSEIEKFYPESPYFVVNASDQNNPRIVDVKDVPVVLIENPLMRDPTMTDNVMVGTARDIRNVITNLRKKYANLERSTTTMLKSRNGSITRYNVDDIIELRMSVPDGAGSLHDVILHVPTLKQAEELLRLGRTKKVEGLLDDMFKDLDPSVRRSFDEFAKAFQRTDPGKYTNDFAPYAFAVEMGRENGYYVGSLGGRYVVEDVLNESYRTFDNLRGVLKFLDEAKIREAPSMTPGVSRSAMEAVEPNGIPDPIKFNFEKVDIPASRTQGLRTMFLSQTTPTQYTMQYLENTVGGQWLRENGLDATKMYNTVQDANRAVLAFSSEKQSQIKDITKGLRKAERPWIYNYIEALDNPAERASLAKPDLYRTKEEVFEEMRTEFGSVRADELAEVAVNVRNYMDEMFVRAGLNWGSFVQHYMPHIRAEAGKRMGNLHSRMFDYTSGINIPEPERLAFYEMARESDPSRLIFETDAVRLMEQYTHMAARNAFLRPVMKDLRHSLNQLVDSVKVKGAIDKDYEQIVRYMGNFFDSVDGIHNVMDHQLRDATNNLMDRVARFLDSRGKPDAEGRPSQKWQRRMATRSKNFVDTLITWSTGAHIAGRPYSAFRNLTQSLVTSGSLLGVDWWLDAVDKVMRPGSLARMEQLGIISRNALPVSGWAEMDIDSFLKRAVSLGMYPFKQADAINRAIAYTMGESRAMHAFDLMQEGKIKNQKAFARRSGMKLYGNANYNQLVDILNLAENANVGRAAFADRLGRLSVDRSQYLYNQFDQPQLFRHGIGRWFGQYTSWPINFINLTSQAIGPRSGMPVADRIGYLTRLSGITGSIATGLYEAGLNPGGFLPWEMADVGPGPQFDLALSAVKGVAGDRESLFTVINNLARYFPYAYEGGSIYRAVQAAQDGDFTEMALHMMSAPMNYDVYPRRDPLTQPLLDKMYKAAASYSEWKMNPANAYRGVREGVENVLY